MSKKTTLAVKIFYKLLLGGITIKIVTSAKLLHKLLR